MIVNNLDLVGFASVPAKTNSPLIVDTNAVLTFAISVEFLKTIAGRNP